jgi:ABC-2 type transport system ATP-binding protein
MTGEQNLRMHAELYGVQRDLVPARMEQVLRMVGLWERKDHVVGTYSGGMRRRLEIARGLMHSPRVLFLDEPTIGLDPQTRRSIWSYIRELKEREEITIFMTTHYMDEAEWCDRIAIMDHGEIVALDAPEALKAQVGTDRVTLHTDDNDATIAALAERFGIEARITEGVVTFGVPGGEEFVPRLFAEWDPAHPPIRSVNVSRPTLDDVFMSYTGSSIRDAEEDPAANRSRQMMRVMHGAGRR